MFLASPLRGLVRNLMWLLYPRLPWRFAQRRIARRTEAGLADPRRRAEALAEMTHLLSAVAGPAEIEATVDPYLRFFFHEEEIRWHPRRAVDQRVEGVQHLLDAHAEGRGVMLHFCHHGYYAGLFAAVARAADRKLHVMGVPGCLGWDVGTRQRQQMLVVRRAGELFYADEGIAGVVDRLARGQVVAIASDAPGSSVVKFTGQATQCASGAVWSARAANTPIVVVDSWQDDKGPVIRLRPAIHPDDFEDTQQLLQLLVSQHEEAIMAWPEATFVPRLTWPRTEA